MPPAYRIAEVCIYSLLNFLPFLVLALYPFRHSLRFSNKITGVFIATITLVQLLLGGWAAFFGKNNAGLISAVSTLLYAAFYFLAVKKHPGKMLFTLLMASNFANLAVMVAKCIEGQLFPSLAVQPYRWSFSLMLLLVEAAMCVPPLFVHQIGLYPGSGKGTFHLCMAVSVADPRNLLSDVVLRNLFQCHTFQS